jgi:predicted DNA-binding ribbon-helix-helix protein
MCDIYTSADPIHYEQRTRSMRIRGVVTSIRLENLCWDILARIASKDQMTTNQLISKLYDEIIERQGRVDNLSSFLRVSCMRYLSYVAEQQEKDHLMMKQSALAGWIPMWPSPYGSARAEILPDFCASGGINRSLHPRLD